MGSWIAFLIVLAIIAGLAFAFREKLARLFEKASVFLKEVRVEMQKVVWPNKEEVKGATFVVLVSVVVMTVAIGFEDWVLSKILRGILALLAKS